MEYNYALDLFDVIGTLHVPIILRQERKVQKVPAVDDTANIFVDKRTFQSVLVRNGSQHEYSRNALDVIFLAQRLFCRAMFERQGAKGHFPKIFFEIFLAPVGAHEHQFEIVALRFKLRVGLRKDRGEGFAGGAPVGAEVQHQILVLEGGRVQRGRAGGFAGENLRRPNFCHGLGSPGEFRAFRIISDLLRSVLSYDFSRRSVDNDQMGNALGSVRLGHFLGLFGAKRHTKPGHVFRVLFPFLLITVKGTEDQFKVRGPGLQLFIRLDESGRELAAGRAPVCAEIEHDELLFGESIGCRRGAVVRRIDESFPKLRNEFGVDHRVSRNKNVLLFFD
mmetsp:Transcript_3936/g.7508  ORF Transcript_3936/g.7508 Transcript_3936/m.7508 type:complete len:335 (+) Transcript_3936:813-1817(+)